MDAPARPAADPPPFDPRPVVLEGRFARLEPLALPHAADLLEAGRDEALWRYMPRPAFRDLDDVRGWIRGALEAAAAGRIVPFAIIDRAAGRAVGSTRFQDIRRDDRGLEIGWTWLAAAAQRTAINTECKLMLLSHAFETLGAVRVQLKTDTRNARSALAIERLGAIREGVFRRHIRCWDGHYRDTVFYSIVDSEWPAAKSRLEGLLAR